MCFWIYVYILKSLLATKFTILNDYRADFWEILPAAASAAVAAASAQVCVLVYMYVYVYIYVYLYISKHMYRRWMRYTYI